MEKAASPYHDCEQLSKLNTIQHCHAFIHVPQGIGLGGASAGLVRAQNLPALHALRVAEGEAQLVVHVVVSPAASHRRPDAAAMWLEIENELVFDGRKLLRRDTDILGGTLSTVGAAALSGAANEK